MAKQKSVLQAASDALAAYLTTALAPDVQVFGSWPEPDQQLRKAVSITSVGKRETEIDATQCATLLSTAELVPPDPVLKSYTWSVAVFRQGVQLDIWATSFAACDDIVARLDKALRAGLGATLGQANADPFRDGCLVQVNPADGYPDSKAEFVFDGQDDDQTPQKSGRDEWRATYMGECSVNYTITKTHPALKRVVMRVKVRESGDPGETDVFTINPDGSVTHTVAVP